VSIPVALAHELQGKALRNSLWLALFSAQILGFDDVAHRLTSLVVEVDDRLDDEADVPASARDDGAAENVSPVTFSLSVFAERERADG
jgi:hypothetical protein